MDITTKRAPNLCAGGKAPDRTFGRPGRWLGKNAAPGATNILSPGHLGPRLTRCAVRLDEFSDFENETLRYAMADMMRLYAREVLTTNPAPAIDTLRQANDLCTQVEREILGSPA